MNSAKQQAYLVILEAENKLHLQLSLEKVGAVVSKKSCQSLFDIPSTHLELPDQTILRLETAQVLELLQISYFLDSSPNFGFPIGKHPLVTCLLKGAFNERPPLSKYASTFEVSTVLTCLSQLGQK